MNLIVERAHQIADDLAHARSRRAFLSAVDQFERILALAPDYPPGAITEDDGQALAALAESVVTHIEERLDRRTDRSAVQRTLASKVYQIRGDVESVYTFVRDTAGNPPWNPAHARAVPQPR